MAKPNYSGEKRRKDLAKQAKQQEKRRRKLEGPKTPAEDGETEPAAETEAAAPQ